MGTAFFDRNRTTASKSFLSPKPSLPLTVPVKTVPSEKVELLTRFTSAWADLERVLEGMPVATMLCDDDQWGRSVCPDAAAVLGGAWQQTALLVTHIVLVKRHPVGGNPTAALYDTTPPARDCSAVELIFKLYHAYREVARLLTTLDEQLLYPRRVSVQSIRAELERLIQQYNLSTEHLRKRTMRVPCRNNPKCYPWRRDRVW